MTPSYPQPWLRRFLRLTHQTGLCSLLLCGGAISAQTTLFSENFTGATVGTTTNNTLAVFCSGTGGNTTNTWRSTLDSAVSSVTIQSDSTTGPNEGSTDATMEVAASSSSGTGYIAKFTSTTLAVGQTITFSFDYRFTAASTASSAAVRFGVYNSNTTDYTVATAGTYDNDDKGYRVFSAGNTTLAGTLQREDGGAGSAGGGGSSDSATLDAAVINFNQGTATAHYSFSITRDSTNQVSLGLTINGVNKLSSAVVDNSISAIYAFDEVLIGTGGANTYRFDNVSVLLSSVPDPSPVPEPSSYALLLSGLAGVAVIAIRGRRNRCRSSSARTAA